MKPRLFQQTSGSQDGGISFPVQQKFFSLECYAFAHEVIGSYLPQLVTLVRSTDEAQATISPCSIPPQVAYPLVDFIDFLDDLSRDLPEIGELRGLTGTFYQCLVYQGVGDEAGAVETARKLLRAARSRLTDCHDIPTMRVILPSFFACACLLNYGYLSEAEENFDLLEWYAEGFTQAREALKILRTLHASLLPTTTGEPISERPTSQSFSHLQKKLKVHSSVIALPRFQDFSPNTGSSSLRNHDVPSRDRLDLAGETLMDEFGTSASFPSGDPLSGTLHANPAGTGTGFRGHGTLAILGPPAPFHSLGPPPASLCGGGSLARALRRLPRPLVGRKSCEIQCFSCLFQRGPRQKMKRKKKGGYNERVCILDGGRFSPLIVVPETRLQ